MFSKSVKTSEDRRFLVLASWLKREFCISEVPILSPVRIIRKAQSRRKTDATRHPPVISSCLQERTFRDKILFFG